MSKQAERLLARLTDDVSYFIMSHKENPEGQTTKLLGEKLGKTIDAANQYLNGNPAVEKTQTTEE